MLVHSTHQSNRPKKPCDALYFGVLNGPTYEELVKYFWVRSEVYDRKAAKPGAYAAR